MVTFERNNNTFGMFNTSSLSLGSSYMTGPNFLASGCAPQLGCQPYNQILAYLPNLITSITEAVKMLASVGKDNDNGGKSKNEPECQMCQTTKIPEPERTMGDIDFSEYS